jgi:hypothetical protein
VAYPQKKIVLLCRDKVLKNFPPETRAKAEATCKTMSIEILSGRFAIGVHNVDEGFIGMVKLEGQWKSVSNNVAAYLQGKTLKPHKEEMPGMKVPPLLWIGHGKGGWSTLDFTNLPAPLKCCCCCGLGGFPCCPPPCCWPICGPCACGYCCGKPEGEAQAKSLGPMAFKSMGFHFNGAGQPPEQQAM